MLVGYARVSTSGQDSPRSGTASTRSASIPRTCTSTTVGRLLFNVLGMVADFEADLIRARWREGMAIAKAAGNLRGKKPKLSVSQEKHRVALHRVGTHTTSGIAELFGVARSTVYRAIQRGGTTPPAA